MASSVGKVKLGVGKEEGAAAFAGWILSPPYRGAGEGFSTRVGLQGVIFDLDGVLVDTARFHFLAWKRLAEELGIGFDERVNVGFRGVGRMECLDMLLGEHGKFFAVEEKRLLGERKNGYYLEMVKGLTERDLAAGAKELAMELKGAGVRVGLVSASCNARLVLRLLGITGWFEGIVDGSEISAHGGKREGFLRGAEKMRVKAERCVVVEDAEAGVKGAREAGMKCVGIAVKGDVCVEGIAEVGVGMMEGMVGSKGKS